MFGRSLNVADLKSGATSYDSARLGAKVLPGMCLTSASCIANWKLYGVIWGGFSWGSYQAGESDGLPALDELALRAGLGNGRRGSRRSRRAAVAAAAGGGCRGRRRRTDAAWAC